MGLRDVAVIGFAYTAVAKDDRHNEVEMIIPVVHDAVAQSGIPKAEIGFTCSGSCDYLIGGPFTFVICLQCRRRTCERTSYENTGR